VDGKYSAHMKDAVKAYQSGKGLTPDGIAGPATLKALGLY
jgi:murein L,D-transpeptidase YcbB/YkuD